MYHTKDPSELLFLSRYDVIGSLGIKSIMIAFYGATDGLFLVWYFARITRCQNKQVRAFLITRDHVSCDSSLFNAVYF
jgi:hypothetical protein